MNPIKQRLTDIDAELLALRDTLDAATTEITITSDDIANVSRAGRLLRDLATIGHSYDGVDWLATAIGCDPGAWAEGHDTARLAMSRVEGTLRDRRKDLKGTCDEIKAAITALERERLAITTAERVIGGES
jgi:hypothetical protein